MAVIVPDINFTSLGFIAPTVFLKADKYVSNFNYYGTFQSAADKWLYLNGKGGSNSVPSGIKKFYQNNTAQTFGINCDFYILVSGKWMLTNYGWIKANINSLPPVIFRFTPTDGLGTYYAILDTFYFGVTATAVSNADPQKIAALDSYYREVQVLKYRYNSFVGFLNTLAVKQLNSIEQRVYNEGLLKLQLLSNEINNVKSISVQYGQAPKVGLPVVLIIAAIAILAGAAGWTVTSIIQEQERTKRINDSYELNKWIATKKQEIAAQVTSGQISQASANSIFSTLDGAAAVANKVAQDAAKDKSIFGNVAEIAKWGVVGYLAFLFFTKKSSVNAK